MKNKNINEEISRIKSLFGNDRLYGNLCEQDRKLELFVRQKDAEKLGMDYKEYNKLVDGEPIDFDPHLLLPLAEIGLGILGTVGCPVCAFLAVGMGLADAALYAKEDDYATAGLVASFSVIPGLALARKIPGVQKLGKEGMIKLGQKLSKASKGSKVELNATEKAVISSLKEPATNKALKGAISKEVKKNSAEVVSNPSLLKKIGSTGVKAMKGIAKIAATGASGYVAGSQYAKSGSAGPLAMLKNKYGDVSKEQWEKIKRDFGSSGSEEDNVLLAQAVKSGWEPGNEVPQKFQTQKYKEDNKEETLEDFEKANKKLDALLAEL